MNFFQSFFFIVGRMVKYEKIFSGIRFKHIWIEEKSGLELPFMSKEVLLALKFMHPTKAPDQMDIKPTFF